MIVISWEFDADVASPTDPVDDSVAALAAGVGVGVGDGESLVDADGLERAVMHD